MLSIFYVDQDRSYCSQIRRIFLQCFALQCFQKPLRSLFGTLQIPPVVNHKGKDVNSDWRTGQWDEQSVLGHAQINKGSPGQFKNISIVLDSFDTPSFIV